jgi:uncharacterized protein (DUF1499 family)
MGQESKNKYIIRPCGDSPNCVSSMDERDKFTFAPLVYRDDIELAKERLKKAMARIPRSTLAEENGDYLRYEVKSLVFRFVDDVEFVFDPQKKVVHHRSASRLGYQDFGVNKKRMNQIKDIFEQE